MTAGPPLRERAMDRQLQRLGEQLSEVRAGLEQQRREMDDLRTALSLYSRTSEEQGVDELVLDQVQTRIDHLDGRIASESERSRRVGDELSELERVRESVDVRLESVEGRIAALAEAAGSEREERTRIDAAIPELAESVDGVGARLNALQAALRRTENGLARLDSSLGREEELRQMVEQHQAIRVRLEDRLRDVEERLQETLELLGSATEERLALRHQIMGFDERMRLLGEALEFQRDAVVDHFRRVIEVEEQQGKRQIDEIEQGLRRGRALLVRLRESGPRSAEEQS